MHDARRPDDGTAVRHSNRLMTEADAKDRDSLTEDLNEFDADAGVFGPAGSRRNHDAVRIEFTEFSDTHAIVPHDANILATCAQKLDEVECERIVIIDDDDHSLPSLSARA